MKIENDFDEKNDLRSYPIINEIEEEFREYEYVTGSINEIEIANDLDLISKENDLGSIKEDSICIVNESLKRISYHIFQFYKYQLSNDKYKKDDNNEFENSINFKFTKETLLPRIIRLISNSKISISLSSGSYMIKQTCQTIIKILLLIFSQVSDINSNVLSLNNIYELILNDLFNPEKRINYVGNDEVSIKIHNFFKNISIDSNNTKYCIFNKSSLKDLVNLQMSESSYNLDYVNYSINDLKKRTNVSECFYEFLSEGDVIDVLIYQNDINNYLGILSKEEGIEITEKDNIYNDLSNLANISDQLLNNIPKSEFSFISSIINQYSNEVNFTDNFPIISKLIPSFKRNIFLKPECSINPFLSLWLKGTIIEIDENNPQIARVKIDVNYNKKEFIVKLNLNGHRTMPENYFSKENEWRKELKILEELNMNYNGKWQKGIILDEYLSNEYKSISIKKIINKELSSSFYEILSKYKNDSYNLNYKDNNSDINEKLILDIYIIELDEIIRISRLDPRIQKSGDVFLLNYLNNYAIKDSNSKNSFNFNFIDFILPYDNESEIKKINTIANYNPLVLNHGKIGLNKSFQLVKNLNFLYCETSFFDNINEILNELSIINGNDNNESKEKIDNSEKIKQLEIKLTHIIDFLIISFEQLNFRFRMTKINSLCKNILDAIIESQFSYVVKKKIVLKIGKLYFHENKDKILNEINARLVKLNIKDEEANLISNEYGVKIDCLEFFITQLENLKDLSKENAEIEKLVFIEVFTEEVLLSLFSFYNLKNDENLIECIKLNYSKYFNKLDLIFSLLIKFSIISSDTIINVNKKIIEETEKSNNKENYLFIYNSLFLRILKSNLHIMNEEWYESIFYMMIFDKMILKDSKIELLNKTSCLSLNEIITVNNEFLDEELLLKYKFSIELEAINIIKSLLIYLNKFSIKLQENIIIIKHLTFNLYKSLISKTVNSQNRDNLNHLQNEIINLCRLPELRDNLIIVFDDLFQIFLLMCKQKETLINENSLNSIQYLSILEILFNFLNNMIIFCIQNNASLDYDLKITILKRFEDYEINTIYRNILFETITSVYSNDHNKELIENVVSSSLSSINKMVKMTVYSMTLSQSFNKHIFNDNNLFLFIEKCISFQLNERFKQIFDSFIFEYFEESINLVKSMIFTIDKKYNNNEEKKSELKKGLLHEIFSLFSLLYNNEYLTSHSIIDNIRNRIFCINEIIELYSSTFIFSQSINSNKINIVTYSIDNLEKYFQVIFELVCYIKYENLEEYHNYSQNHGNSSQLNNSPNNEILSHKKKIFKLIIKNLQLAKNNNVSEELNFIYGFVMKKIECLKNKVEIDSIIKLIIILFETHDSLSSININSHYSKLAIKDSNKEDKIVLERSEINLKLNILYNDETMIQKFKLPTSLSVSAYLNQSLKSIYSSIYDKIEMEILEKINHEYNNLQIQNKNRKESDSDEIFLLEDFINTSSKKEENISQLYRLKEMILLSKNKILLNNLFDNHNGKCLYELLDLMDLEIMTYESNVDKTLDFTEDNWSDLKHLDCIFNKIRLSTVFIKTKLSFEIDNEKITRSNKSNISQNTIKKDDTGIFDMKTEFSENMFKLLDIIDVNTKYFENDTILLNSFLELFNYVPTNIINKNLDLFENLESLEKCVYLKENGSRRNEHISFFLLNYYSHIYVDLLISSNKINNENDDYDIESILKFFKFSEFYLRVYCDLDLIRRNSSNLKLLINIIVKSMFILLRKSKKIEYGLIFNENDDNKTLLIHYYICYFYKSSYQNNNSKIMNVLKKYKEFSEAIFAKYDSICHDSFLICYLLINDQQSFEVQVSKCQNILDSCVKKKLNGICSLFIEDICNKQYSGKNIELIKDVKNILSKINSKEVSLEILNLEEIMEINDNYEENKVSEKFKKLNIQGVTLMIFNDENKCNELNKSNVLRLLKVLILCFNQVLVKNKFHLSSSIKSSICFSLNFIINKLVEENMILNEVNDLLLNLNEYATNFSLNLLNYSNNLLIDNNAQLDNINNLNNPNESLSLKVNKDNFVYLTENQINQIKDGKISLESKEEENNLNNDILELTLSTINYKKYSKVSFSDKDSLILSLLISHLNEEIKDQKENVASSLAKQVSYKNERRNATGYMGLNNLGSTCYMNSVLQQLFFIKPLRNILLNLDLSETKNIDALIELSEKSNNSNNLYLRKNYSKYKNQIELSLMISNIRSRLEFQKMIANLYLSTERSFYPSSFVYEFKDMNGNPTNPSLQQDAQEFLGRLFEKMEKSLIFTKYKYVIKDIFSGELCNVLICHSCNKNEFQSNKMNKKTNFFKTKTKIKYDDFYQLSLECRGPNNLFESLNLFTTKEVIESYNCETCNNNSTIYKQIYFANIPNILIIHLKKIDFDILSGQNKKINKRFEFPKKLNMKKYCIEMEENFAVIEESDENNKIYTKVDDYYQYSLKGVVVHMGTADSGHYYSYINVSQEGEGECWLEFNDSNVTFFDPSNLKKETFGGDENDSRNLINNDIELSEVDKQINKNEINQDYAKNEIDLSKKIQNKPIENNHPSQNENNQPSKTAAQKNPNNAANPNANNSSNTSNQTQASAATQNYDVNKFGKALTDVELMKLMESGMLDQMLFDQQAESYKNLNNDIQFGRSAYLLVYERKIKTKLRVLSDEINLIDKSITVNKSNYNYYKKKHDPYFIENSLKIEENTENKVNEKLTKNNSYKNKYNDQFYDETKLELVSMVNYDKLCYENKSNVDQNENDIKLKISKDVLQFVLSNDSNSSIKFEDFINSTENINKNQLTSLTLNKDLLGNIIENLAEELISADMSKNNYSKYSSILTFFIRSMIYYNFDDIEYGNKIYSIFKISSQKVYERIKIYFEDFKLEKMNLYEEIITIINKNYLKNEIIEMMVNEKNQFNSELSFNNKNLSTEVNKSILFLNETSLNFLMNLFKMIQLTEKKDGRISEIIEEFYLSLLKVTVLTVNLTNISNLNIERLLNLIRMIYFSISNDLIKSDIIFCLLDILIKFSINLNQTSYIIGNGNFESPNLIELRKLCFLSALTIINSNSVILLKDFESLKLKMSNNLYELVVVDENNGFAIKEENGDKAYFLNTTFSCDSISKLISIDFFYLILSIIFNSSISDEVFKELINVKLENSINQNLTFQVNSHINKSGSKSDKITFRIVQQEIDKDLYIMFFKFTILIYNLSKNLLRSITRIFHTIISEHSLTDYENIKMISLSEANQEKDIFLKISSFQKTEKNSNFKNKDKTFDEFIKFSLLYIKNCISYDNSCNEDIIGVRESIIYKNTSQPINSVKNNNFSEYSLLYQNKLKTFKIFNYFNPLFNELISNFSAINSSSSSSSNNDSNKFSSFFKSSFQKAYNVLTNNSNTSEKEKIIHFNENMALVNNYSFVEKLISELSKKYLDNMHIFLQKLLMIFDSEIKKSSNSDSEEEDNFKYFLICLLTSASPFAINKNEYNDYLNLKYSDSNNDNKIVINNSNSNENKLKNEFVICSLFDYVSIKSISEIKESNSSLFNTIINKLSIGKLNSEIKNDQIINMLDVIGKYIDSNKFIQSKYDSYIIKENISNEIHLMSQINFEFLNEDSSKKEDLIKTLGENNLLLLNSFLSLSDVINKFTINKIQAYDLKEYQEDNKILVERDICKIIKITNVSEINTTDTSNSSEAIFYKRLSDEKNEKNDNCTFGKISLFNSSTNTYKIKLKIEFESFDKIENINFYNVKDKTNHKIIYKTIKIIQDEVISIFSYLLPENFIDFYAKKQFIKVSIIDIVKLSESIGNNISNDSNKDSKIIQDSEVNKDNKKDNKDNFNKDKDKNKNLKDKGFFGDLIIIEENENEEDNKNNLNNNYEMSMEDIIAIQKLNQEDRMNYGAASAHANPNTNAAAAVGDFNGNSMNELVEIECIKCGKKNIIIESYICGYCQSNIFGD